MIASPSPYPAYKDSGVPWLGEVPEHWETRRLKQAFFKITGGSTPSSSEAAYWEGNIVWITPADVSRSARLSTSLRYITQEGLQSCSTELVPAGSIIVTSRAPVGNVAIAETELCTNQGCKALVTIPDVLYPLYGFHILTKSKDELQSLAVGTTFTEISTDRIGDVRIPIPPLSEQAAIVRYLDYMDRRIQRFIRAKQKLIKLLEEQKQAIVHQAVTGRIDVQTGKPYPKYKPSGVEWLGVVPEHWGMVPNRALLQLQKKLVGNAWNSFPLLSLTKQGIILRDMENPEGKFPTSFETYQEVCPGDLVFCLFDIDETPRAVGLSSLHGMITGAYTRFGCESDSVKWVSAFYHAMDNGKRLKPLYSGLRKVITKSAFLSAKMPYPDARERDSILENMEVILSDLSITAHHAQRKIDLLSEYRTRLISEVVTGKLDVREAAANLPEEPGEELLEHQLTEDPEEPEYEEEDECLEDEG